MSCFALSINPPATVKVTGKDSGMHDRSSSGHRERIAQEMETIVKTAASPVRPGETVKGQIRRAWVELGRPAYWRVRAAWHGESGNWIGRAIEDFRERASELEAKRKRQSREARAEAAAQLAQLHRLRDALAETDPEFHRQTINAVEWAITSSKLPD